MTSPTEQPMKALTLHYSWAFAVACLNKDIENRTRPPPSTMPLGSRFAIHAGLTGTAAEWAAIDTASGPGRLTYPAMCRAPRSAVVAVATLAGWQGAIDKHGVAAGACLSGLDRAGLVLRRSLWWIGPVGWLLADVVTLPVPVPAKGALGLWTLPALVAAEVAKQERAARAAGDGR